MLSFSYLAALVSFYKQADMLVSKRGILPAYKFIDAVNERNLPFTAAPTILRWYSEIWNQL